MSRLEPLAIEALNSSSPFISIVTSDPCTNLVHRMSNVTTDPADKVIFETPTMRYCVIDKPADGGDQLTLPVESDFKS
jgi:hypothetical protein